MIIEIRSMRYSSLPKRELLKLTYREFRALGLSLKRGQSFMKTKHFCRLIKSIKKIAKAHKTNEIDFERLNDPNYREEFNAWAEPIIRDVET